MDEIGLYKGNLVVKTDAKVTRDNDGFYEFGDCEKPTVLLIHGTACNWQGNFATVILKLAEYYHVICVNMRGFNGNDKEEFDTISKEVIRIEDYILKNYNGHIKGVYGSSLGGSLVGLMLGNGRVKFDHAITGGTDFDQMTGLVAKMTSKLFVKILLRGIRTEKWGILKKLFGANKPEGEKFFETSMNCLCKTMTKRTLYNQFYTDLITPVKDGIIIPQTKIHCIYGTKEGKKKPKRYITHFPQAELLPQEGLNHEELLLLYPDKWVELIRNILH